MPVWNKAHYCILFALTAALCANGATIVSTFNNTPPGYIQDSYRVSAFFGLPIPPGHTDWAMEFTVPAGPDYQFTGISVPLRLDNPTPSNIDFTVASDMGGVPGAALATVTFSVSSSTDMIFAGASASQPTLSAGATYWLIGSISPDTPNGAVDWFTPTHIFGAPPSTVVATRSTPMNPAWSLSPGPEAAFEIDGLAIASTPEPSAFLLVMAGLMVVSGLAKSKRRVSED
jgi:hypothetical protein